MRAFLSFLFAAVLMLAAHSVALGQCSGGQCGRSAVTFAPQFYYAAPVQQACPAGVANCQCGCANGGQCTCAKAKAVPACDALDEVNRLRTVRGLRPFKRAADLTAGALHLVAYRAKVRCHGHTQNDFAALPVGSRAAAAGAEGYAQPGWGGWKVGEGYASCCMYDTQYAEAGAAWCVGEDGQQYCQMFVR